MRTTPIKRTQPENYLPISTIGSGKVHLHLKNTSQKHQLQSHQEENLGRNRHTSHNLPCSRKPGRNPPLIRNPQCDKIIERVHLHPTRADDALEVDQRKNVSSVLKKGWNSPHSHWYMRHIEHISVTGPFLASMMRHRINRTHIKQSAHHYPHPHNQQ